MEIKVTNHARERIKERMGINKKACERIAQKAYDSGMGVDQLKGSVKDYVKSKKGAETKIYGEYVYIFDKDVLVTTYRLPKQFLKVVS